MGSDKRGSSGRAGIDNLLSHAADKSGREPGRQGPLTVRGRTPTWLPLRLSSSPPTDSPSDGTTSPTMSPQYLGGKLCVCECHACLQAAAAGRATCRRDTHVCWRKAGEGKSRIWSILHSGIYGVNTVQDNPTSSVRKIPENSARCKVQPTSICVINEIQLFRFAEANSCRCRCGHTRWFCLPPAPSSASSFGTTANRTHGSS